MSYIVLIWRAQKPRPSGWLLESSGQTLLTVSTHVSSVYQIERLISVESLFLPSSSPERKHWGFLLLAKVLATAPSAYLKDVFTTNTVSLLVTHLKIDERYLHRSATKALQTLHNRAAQDPNVAMYAVQGLLLGPSRVYKFDAVTKTKTVAKLLKAADLATFRHLVPSICSNMEQPQGIDEKQTDTSRKELADVLVSIWAIIFAMLNEESNTLKAVAETILDALMGLAYSTKSIGSGQKTFDPLPSPQCRAYLRSRMRTCLDQGLQHHTLKAELFRHIIRKLKDLQQQVDPSHKIIELDGETQGIVDTAWKSLRKISKTVSLAKSHTSGRTAMLTEILQASRAKAEPEARSAEVLEMLYSLAFLQLYDGDTDAPGILQDLNTYQNIQRRNSSASTGTAQSDSVLEILLSFASKPSRFFHQTGLQAFRAFASQVSRAGLLSLIRVRHSPSK
jgi:DNA polymerase phi